MLLTFYKTVFQNKVLHKDIDEPLHGKQNPLTNSDFHNISKIRISEFDWTTHKLESLASLVSLFCQV